MRRRVKALLNAALLFAALVSLTLYSSELGGPGSVWNVVAAALLVAFIIGNIRLRSSFIGLFALPIMLAALSAVVNIDAVETSYIRSLLATVISFGVLAMPSVILDRRAFQKLMLAYLLACLALSAWITLRSPHPTGNPNFNVNPNAAAQLFFLCIASALLYVKSPVKWPVIAGYFALMLTTQARMASLAAAFSLVIYAFLHYRRGRLRLEAAVVRTVFRVLAFAAVGGLALYVALPEYSTRFAERFGQLWHYESLARSRLAIWRIGFDISFESARSLAFGHGPATISRMIGRGSHSSYIEAAGSYGYLFLLAGVSSVIAWIALLARHGRREILIVGIPLLLYGLTETFLFTGISMLWLLLGMTGIYLRARPPEGTKDRALDYRLTATQSFAGRSS